MNSRILLYQDPADTMRIYLYPRIGRLRTQLKAAGRDIFWLTVRKSISAAANTEAVTAS